MAENESPQSSYPSIPVPPSPPAAQAGASQTGPTIQPGLTQAKNLTPEELAKLTSTICASCGAVVPMYYTFCPNCGKSLNFKPLSTSTLSKIWIYTVSVLLPPLGFWPGVKYFKSGDPKAQRMGIIAIALTVISTIVTIWLTFALAQSYLGDINSALSGTGITPTQATGGLF